MKDKHIRVNVVYADGFCRPAVISAGAVALVKRYARMMPSLFAGTGFNPLNADISNIIAITRADHEILHQSSGGQRKTDFRLGQMDMKASVCDMLRELANGAADPVSAGLVLAADLVETMEVPYADTGE